MQSKTDQPKLKHTIVPGNLKLAFWLSEDPLMAFSVPALVLLGRGVRDAGLQVFGVLSAPTGWELGSQDLCGAPRPQQTELCVCCKQDISLQGLTDITGHRRNSVLSMRSFHTPTINICAIWKMWEKGMVG